MVAERSSALVLLSHSSSDAPIPILARRLGAKVAPRLLAALDFRLDQTLASVGHRFGVTRERARQLEQKGRAQIEPLVVAWAEAFQLEWAAQLGSLAVSEEELFGALRDPAIDTDSQNRLGRLALITLFPTAAHPSTFRGAEVEGWWTLDRLALPRALRSMTKSCPLNDEEFDALLTRLNVPQALPAGSILQAQGGPVRYYPAVGAWVRARASHRDAAVWMLQEAGQPLAPADLANRLGLNAKALNANLARDRRVRQLRPTGLWTLLDWTSAQDDAEAFASTIDAVVAVLFEHGPLRRKALRQNLWAKRGRNRRPSPLQQTTVRARVKGPLARSAAAPPLTPAARRGPGTSRRWTNGASGAPCRRCSSGGLRRRTCARKSIASGSHSTRIRPVS